MARDDDTPRDDTGMAPRRETTPLAAARAATRAAGQVAGRTGRQGAAAQDAGADPDADPGAVPDQAQAPEAMRKKELIERVVARSGLRRREARAAVEAMLSIMGETLAAERELRMQPLGRIRVTRSAERPGARVLTARIRQRDPLAGQGIAAFPQEDENSASEPLAEDRDYR